MKDRSSIHVSSYQRKIGILGGTFNPIHSGHLIMAEAVYKHHRLSKVLFIPAYIPPHKSTTDLVDARHRYQMVKAAISRNENFEVSDFEIKRKVRSYTIDTVNELLELYGKDCEVFLIMGADSLSELESWKDIKKLSQLCYFVIVNRPGYSIYVSEGLTDVIGRDKVSDIERLSVEIKPIEISSTDIRRRLKEGIDVKDLVPPCVEAYIREHCLYSCC